MVHLGNCRKDSEASHHASKREGSCGSKGNVLSTNHERSSWARVGAGNVLWWVVDASSNPVVVVIDVHFSQVFHVLHVFAVEICLDKVLTWVSHAAIVWVTSSINTSWEISSLHAWSILSWETIRQLSAVLGPVLKSLVWGFYVDGNIFDLTVSSEVWAVVHLSPVVVQGSSCGSGQDLVLGADGGHGERSEGYEFHL